MSIIASLTIFFHLFTYHYKFTDVYNYLTLGIGIAYKDKICAGVYYNSVEELSYYLAYQFDNNLILGIATGYKNKKYKGYKFKKKLSFNGISFIVAYNLKINNHSGLLISPAFISLYLKY